MSDTILFYIYSSERKGCRNKNVRAVMDNIYKMNKRLGNKLDPSIDAHNKRLIKITVIICRGLLLILIGAIVYFTVYKRWISG